MTNTSLAVNPHAPLPYSLIALIRSLLKNWQLILQMTKRDVIGKYKGSVMGLAWSFLNPIVMLIVYTFVFSEIFKSRWSGINATESKSQFAVILFVGIIVLSLISEVLNRSAVLMVSNVNYIKKVIFPLEILSIVSVLTACFHSLVSILVLIFGLLILNGELPWTILYLPLVLIPFLFLVLGLSWILASLGVYLKDVGQAMGIITTMMTFLSPVFYPLSAVPESVKPLILLNPPTFVIEQIRSILLWGKHPSWFGLVIYYVVAISIAWIGFIWFQKTRKGFADVL